MYLEPIFSSEDISRQLPTETKKFNTCERNWRRIMKNAHDCPYVIKFSYNVTHKFFYFSFLFYII